MDDKLKEHMVNAALVIGSIVMAVLIAMAFPRMTFGATFRSADRVVSWDLTVPDIVRVELESRCNNGEWEPLALIDITSENQQTSLPVTFCSPDGGDTFTAQVRHRFYDALGPGEWCESELAEFDLTAPPCAVPRIE